MFVLLPVRRFEDEEMETVEIMLDIRRIISAEAYVNDINEVNTWLLYERSRKEIVEYEIALSIDEVFSLIEVKRKEEGIGWWRN